MAYLTAEELTAQYYRKAADMKQDDVAYFLQRANAYAFGIIGGPPPTISGDDGSNLKTAVAMAFEFFAKGETGQANEVTGEISDAAPASQSVKEEGKHPLKIVEGMLEPYAAAFRAATTVKSSKAAVFL